MNKLIALLILGSMYGVAAPPDSATPAPAPPFCASPKPGSRWTIAVKYPEAPKDAPAGPAESSPRLASIESVYGAEYSRVVIIDVDGRASEGYVFGPRVIRLFPGSPSAGVLPSDEENPASPVFVRGFQGVGWLSLATYKGVETIGEEKCYRFAKPAETFSDPELGMSHPELTAWVRVSDKTPVLFRIGDVEFRYSAIASGTSDAPLPPLAARTLKMLRQEAAALEAMKSQ